MNPKNEEKFDFQLSDEFSKDLESLFEPTQSMSPRIDRAVMDKAAKHLPHRAKRRKLAYWPAFASAVAAVIVIGIVLLNAPDNSSSARPAESVAIQMDINADGRIDILDAFKLARYLKTDNQPDMNWDINADGAVNFQDVDHVATAAVKLTEGVL